MRILSLGAVIFAAAMLTASSAAAQGRRPGSTPTPTPTPPIWNDGATAPAPSVTSPLDAPVRENEGYRPEGTSIGLGAGFDFSATSTGEMLWNPNTVSARYRFASGLELEPIAGIAIQNDSSKVDSAKTTSTATEIFLGTNVRKPFWSRNQAETMFIVGADMAIGSSSSKDAADQKTSASSLGVGAGWGIGVEFWPRSHWSIGFTAMNPLLGFTSSSSKDAAGVKTSTVSTTLSPKFDPTMRLMTHLYY